MKTKTNVKAGRANVHNLSFTKVLDKTSPVSFESTPNHNQTELRVKTRLKAGAIIIGNHNQTKVRASAPKRLRYLRAPIAIAAGLFAQSAFAQAGATFRGSPLACNTSAGASSFTVASWSLALDSTGHDPTTVTITKPFDACSAALYKMANPGPKGSRMKAASITVRPGEKAEVKGTALVTIEMDNVGISNYTLNGGANTETFTLTFTSVSVIWP